MRNNVFLFTKNIRTAITSRKLDWKPIGSFLVEKVVSTYAYRLTLPAWIKLHPVFQVFPAPNDAVPGKPQPPPPTLVIDDKIEYEIEEILDSKTVRN